MAITAAIVGGALAIVAAIIGALVTTERLIITDLFRWRRVLPGGFIIIINGSSGVGKSTLAWALARRFNIASVLGTDLVREVLRYNIPTDATDSRGLLLTSSFLAHHRLSAELPEEKSGGVIEAFRLQCRELIGPIVRVVNRVRTKRDPLIIEGVNILASDVFEHIPIDAANGVFFVNLYLDSTDRHLARLRDRGAKAREFPELTDRYIREIAAIRQIDTFLREDTKATLSASPDGQISIISVENSGSIARTVDIAEKAIRRKLQHLPKGKG